MSYMCLCLIVAALIVYFEWHLITTALVPIMGIAVAIFYMVMLAVLILADLALIVVAPAALFLGYESRDWHIRVARKLMFVRG